MIVIIVLLVSLLSTTISLESNFHSEESCSSKSGACVLENECPHAVDAEYKSLCKNQQQKGAICCKNFPLQELNCHQSHNDCRRPKECHKSLNLGQKGCEEGNICCVLV